ncbi:MAG: long-chain fatty acid--CoA ligase [Anaerolineae bacterium]|nr:long-chain fatty acid--CoA ligase [Anaerolineae bacterium]NUQ02794.1 long-chain fatty acid--CoA ligase [Anaerolineae bacterium]
MVTYKDKPWLKHYDRGVRPSLEPYPNKPLFELLRECARRAPNNIALTTSAHLPIFGRVAANLTYADVDQASDALGASLVDMGLKKGDRVGLIMPNTAAFVICYFGILKAGGVVVATNPTYPPEKMKEQLNDSGATFAICLTLFYKALKSIQAGTQIKSLIVTNVKDYLTPLARLLFTLAREKKDGHFIDALAPGDHWLKDVLEKYAGKNPNVVVTGDDLAIFQYTGGTTGIPKGAMSQHKALVANTTQCMAVLLGGDKTSKGDKEVFLGAIPFFHAYGLITVVGFAMSLGARIILVPNARDFEDLLDVINVFKPSIFMGVPALYNAINNHPRVKAKEVDLTSIRICMSGSAPLPPATKREFERLTGGKLLEGYGMSEAPTASHANPLEGENREGSIGLPFPDMDVRIVSLDDGETELAVGEVGELIMHGPQLMVGYHGMPTETANTLRMHDGKTFLYSGDIARMDEDGYFYIVDRKKDMALIGGFNVFPVNVDKVLADHPAVMDVAVAAIPHPEKDGQEALKAWIVVKPGMQVTDQELIDFASKRLARYEVPTRFAYIDALPKTTVGKTLRRELILMELAEREKRAT